jgi:hypothetical protein
VPVTRVLLVPLGRYRPVGDRLPQVLRQDLKEKESIVCPLLIPKRGRKFRIDNRQGTPKNKRISDSAPDVAPTGTDEGNSLSDLMGRVILLCVQTEAEFGV